MRMSNSVTVKENTITMKGSEAEEYDTIPSGILRKSESQEQMESERVEGNSDNKNESQVNIINFYIYCRNLY
uniref:Uncharacterized protein n=1 Tax=Erpetoichthys calabaricus TaxID=27687 RepID=A0A8C4SER1_ERPCA